MSKKVYLVSLTGQGDHYRIIVEKNVWDWIHSKPVFKAGEYCVDEFFPDIGRVNVTIGSWENDRMMACTFLPTCFSSYKEMNKYLKDNDMEIEQEIDGEVY